MSDIGTMIARSIINWLALFGAACFALGALLVWGLPKLWDWIKPILHGATA